MKCIALPLVLLSTLLTSELCAHNFIIETNNKKLDINDYLAAQNQHLLIHNIYDLQHAINLLAGAERKRFINDLEIPKTNLISDSGNVTGLSSVTINQTNYRISIDGELSLDQPKQKNIMDPWWWR